MKLFPTLGALGIGLLVTAAHALPVYFLEKFDVNPPLSATQAPGVYYTDRYAPRFFDSQSFMGDQRLRVQISALDGAVARGGGFTSGFYNTQGRKFDLDNGHYTSLKAKLWVGADWSTQLRRADLWATTIDLSNTISGFPIIGFANLNTATPNLICRVFTQDIDQNPGNGNQSGWVTVSSKVPGGVTTNRWYSLEIKLKPGVYEFFVDGKLVYSDGATFDSVKFANLIVQGFNFNDASLGAGSYPPALDETYDIYWDDLSACASGQNAFPVDLNGSYRASSSGPVVPNPTSNADRSQPGIASATTFGIPLFGHVYETNGTNAVLIENAGNGTFTPFNDANKKPNTLTMATANNTSFEADVELSGTWKPFQWGAGIGNVPPFATGDTFNVGYVTQNTASMTANSFGVQFVTDFATGQYKARIASTLIPMGSLGALETNGTPVLFPMGVTKVRVNAGVVGGVFTATVQALDGPNPFQVQSLGSTNGLNLDTNVPWMFDVADMAFNASFVTYEHNEARANATVSNFNANIPGNALYAFANDPYVRSSDPMIEYRVGQANLLQLITGYQAFMFGGTGQNFVSGSYEGPYTQFNPGVIGLIPMTNNFNIAAAGGFENQANLDVAKLIYAPGAAESTTGLGFRPNVGTENTLFSGGAPNFDDILADRTGSNTVLIDNTAPTIGTPSLAGSAWQNPNVVQGNLMITVLANDGGSFQSGLDGRPNGQITWSNSTTTPVNTYSSYDNNFRAIIPITPSTPNGTATLSLTVCDRAGNCTTETLTFNVSTVNVTMTVTEVGVTADVNRVINFTVGATGGPSAPILVRKIVNFNVATMVGPDPARQGSVLITYQDLDLADDTIANNSVNPGAVLTRVYTKDPFFSLGKQENLSGSMGFYTGSAILTMGDVTNNNVVNVSDLAVWTANNGSAMSADTTLAQMATPRQANIDGAGIVNLGDRNLILASWLLAGDANGTGNFAPGSRDGSQTVMEVIRETGLPRAIVISMDLNGDNRITREELLRWRPRFK